MKKSYRDLLRHSSVYGLGEILNRLASFLLLPIYTSHLTPADYGCLAILDLTTGILGVLIGSGIATAVIRHHFEARNALEVDRIWWTGLTFVALMATAVIAPVWLLREPLGRSMLGTAQTHGGFFFTLALSTLWFGTIGHLANGYLRVRKWSALLVWLSFVRLLLNISLNIYFLVVLRQGVVGILLGNLISSGMLTAVLCGILWCSRGPYAFDRVVALKLWRFGAPLIVTALLAITMHKVDRYLLGLFQSMDQVGIYSIAYTIGQAVNTLCLVPFTSIWGVVIYEIAAQPDAKKIYGRVFEFFLYGLMLVMLGVSLFARPVLALMAPADYAGAADLIPIVCLAYVLFSLHEHFKVPALLAKRTVSLLPAFLAGAATNVGLNLVLIPLLGAIGAAWASVATFAIFSSVGLWYYRKIDQYEYPFFRCGLVMLGMVGSFCLVLLARGHGIDRISDLTLSTSLLVTWSVVLLGRPIFRWYAGRKPDADMGDGQLEAQPIGSMN